MTNPKESKQAVYVWNRPELSHTPSISLSHWFDCHQSVLPTDLDTLRDVMEGKRALVFSGADYVQRAENAARMLIDLVNAAQSDETTP